MTIVDSFPHAVREVPHLWIPLADGCRLAARIWLPEDAEARPVPAILEYLPYRKRDGTAVRDQLTHPYLAGHGYACLRVDMRGNGDSDGLMADEYAVQEQDDALEVIDWLERQPWCTGRVGMMGISWGGFNGLQVAARGPAALRAVVTLCSTDDRYADDIHYKGGCLLNENLGWGTTMLSYSSRPPDPLLYGEGWRAAWLERLEKMPFLPALWLEHQHRDAYWRHGSIAEGYGAIQAAVLAVGGWGDAYRNAIPRLLAGLEAPCRAIIGPWVHKYPHFAVPAPAGGFLQEALRWFDRWLKDIDTGVEADPPLRAYLMDGVRPRTFYESRPGRWLGGVPGTDVCRYHLGPGQLLDEPGAAATLEVRSPQTVGGRGGEYCAIWLGPDWPGDQREDDGRSLCFDGAPLAESLDILGATHLHLDVEVDRAQTLLAARLCHLHPDGASTRVTYGVLNLSHHDGHGEPMPLEPGRRYRITLQMDDIGYRVPAGHRLRLALSTSYWPLLWPSATTARVIVHTATASLDVPRAGPEWRPADMPPAETAPPLELHELRAPEHRREVHVGLADGAEVTTLLDDFGAYRHAGHGLVTGSRARERYSIQPDDPLSARAECHWTQTLARCEWNVRTEAHASMTADGERFYLQGRLEAFEDETPVHEQSWRREIPRKLV